MDENIVDKLMASTGGADTSSRSKSVLDKLAERLTSQGKGISTSSSSGVQAEIEKAMKDISTSGEATYQRLQSERGRELSFAKDRAGAKLTAAREGQTGYAQQVAGLNELTRTTEKSIRDLDTRYQESIMANDANTASQLASLRMEKLNFLDKQEQNFYTNLFSLAGLAQQEDAAKSETERFWAGKKFDEAMFDKQVFKEERNAMLSIAAEHGVDVGTDDTIESIIKKVSPFISQKRALELSEMQTSIDRNRAEISAALRGEKEDAAFDDVTARAFATAYMQGNTDIMVGIKTPAQAASVMAAKKTIENETEASISEFINTSSSEKDFMEKIAASDRVVISREEAAALWLASQVEKTPTKKTKADRENLRSEARKYFDYGGVMY